MDELEKTPGDIVKEARQSFEKEKRGALEQQSPGFNVSRGLDVDRQLETGGYLKFLPTFEGKTFDALLGEEITRREVESKFSRQPFRKVIVVDAGYGSGAFLIDCYQKWGDKISLVGFGTDVYTKLPIQSTAGKSLPTTYEELLKAGVQMIEGNIIDIKKDLPVTADFLVSSNVLEYVKYPKWEMLKKFYRTLSPSGIALLHDTGFLPSQSRNLQEYLNSQGYQFEVHSRTVAFRKTKEDINLPVRSVGNISHGLIHIKE